MSREDELLKVHGEAMDTIRRLCADEDPQVAHLCTWLWEGDWNPYSVFREESVAARFGSAEGIASVFRRIHHSIADDGDITYVVVNGSPRISFYGNYNIDTEFWETESERHNRAVQNAWRERTRQQLGTHGLEDLRLIVRFLNTAFEFTAAYEAAEIEMEGMRVRAENYLARNRRDR